MSDPVYTVERHPHGFLIRGPIPVSALKSITAMAKADGFDLMDTSVAYAADAALAITDAAGSGAWRAALNAAAVGRAGDDVELAWLLGTDTGISSRTIFSVLSRKHGHQALRSYPDVPHDPDDFGRCYRLLQAIPAWRDQLSRVSRRHKAWGPLVREWAELERLYEEELPTGRAPKLYALMKGLLGRAA